MSPRYSIQQPFQMFAAVTPQAINGILFARLPGLTKRFEVFLAAAVVCLYLAILDTYTYRFARDHPTFAIGDTLALAGILCLATKRPMEWRSWARRRRMRLR